MQAGGRFTTAVQVGFAYHYARFSRTKADADALRNFFSAPGRDKTASAFMFVVEGVKNYQDTENMV